MKKLLIYFLTALSLFGANVQIRDLTVQVQLPASNTYLITDGATQGTAKFLLATLPQITNTRTTLAALSVTGISTGVSVQTLGGSAVADGNAGLYYYNSASVATPNGTTIIQPSVGSGRWLIVSSSALPTPTTTTLGGVFSKAAVSHYFLTAIGTDGTPAAAIPTTADISGLGTIATQNSNAVTITGGTIAGMTSIAGTTGAFTNTTTSGLTLSGTAGVLFSAGSGRMGADATNAFMSPGASGGSILFQSPALANWAAVTSTGFQGAIGQTTPNVGTFTTTNWSSNANRRTTKTNLNITVINVKDFGAVGNGTTDDAVALAAAAAAMTSNATLYFPPGKYRFATPVLGFSGLSNITVTGDGAELYNDTGAAGLDTMYFSSTCNNVQVRNLRFTGSSTVRGNGIHIRLYCSNSAITNNYFQGCSDFAIHVSNEGATWSSAVVVANNVINGPLGDGIHVGNGADVAITGNVIVNPGDDGIGIIADNTSFPPSRVSIVGNMVYNGASDGIRINEANDVVCDSNLIHYTKGAGIEVNRYLSTTAFNSRILIANNKLWGTQRTLGPMGAIWINFGLGVTVTGNKIDSPVNGSGICFLDVEDLVISNNQLRDIPSRGIASNDTTTTDVRANSYRTVIKDNEILYVQANEAIYVVAPPGTTINDMVIDNNVGQTLPGGNWIYWDRVTTGRVVNNTRTGSQTINFGGTTSGVTQANNN